MTTSKRWLNFRIAGTLRGLILIIIVLLFWENANRWFGIPAFIVPPPSDIWESLSNQYPYFLEQTKVTLLAAGTGFLVGNLIAVVLSSLFLYSETLERIVLPFAIALRSIPLIALIPILLLWLGYGFIAKVSVVSMVCFFPMLVNTSEGLQGVSKSSLVMMHTLSASRWQVYRKIRFWNALPLMFSALRVNAASAVLATMISEYLTSNSGLGFLVMHSYSNMRYPDLWAAMLIGTFAAMFLFFAISAIERRAIPWHESIVLRHKQIGQ